ncbi:MAG: M23 family metallopeptidase [Bacteroidales bacterium]|nr:M23 family metallopeptidase [Bacteroidales bacterium]
MNDNKKKQKRKLRLSILDDHSLEEVRALRLSRPLIFSIVGGSILIIGLLIFLLLAYTPLNSLIPQRTSSALKNKVIKNSLLIDSLETEILQYDSYLNNVKNILQGNPPSDTFEVNKIYQDTVTNISKSEFNSSKLDSLIRAQLEEAETGAINPQSKQIKESIKNIHFTMPLRGIVSNEFNPQKSHYGIDIVPGNDETISATLSGTVILATWSVETGYIIGIQHNFNFVSFYKHNSVLLKKVGDRVKSGESIAIVGNSGENTTGPHLHFELWYNGTPVNPRDYISF